MVVELGSWLAAPGATAMLSDIGAEVIKVEPPTGDPGRHFIAAMGGETETTPSFSLLNRGKKSVVIDLAHEAGRAQFEQLLATADVFVTNMRLGSLDRIGLSPDAVVRRYPRLIYASITGFGLRGNECDTPVYDVGGFWARSGVMHQITPPDSPPPSPTGGFGDLITSLAIYAAIVTALLERERTGTGGIVESSLLQAGVFAASADLAVQAAHQRLAGQALRTESRTPLVNSYRSSDGRWFYLTGVEAQRHFPNICHAIERADLIDNARFSTAKLIRQNGRELIAILDAAFSRHTLSEWSARFATAGVWWQAVAAPAEVIDDPQLKANDMLHPVWNGDQQYLMATAPFSLFRRRHEAERAPTLGEHTKSVLNSLRASEA
jgi:crotonobetainyl-CoA:carnitine CoA-transferase CaiB-like acyl-CoA transferase